ncbi:MAG: TfuA-like protein [Candidatus Acidiferrales bacterium]
MRVYVFTGPSLPPRVARRHWDGPIYLPPVAQGDVYQIARQKPWGIGIIDGLFERVPAVWHKEILWALSQGIHVYGSASMGALRSAELAEFGMVGVGVIFEDYASAAIEDDDEVMRAHHGAARNYETSSEAMINFRCTLARGIQERIICAKTAEDLARLGKALFYPHRNYKRIVEEGLRCELPIQELQRFREWLPKRRIDQQRLDAIAMLTLMRKEFRVHPQPKRVNFSLAHTKYWDHLQRGSRRRRV